VGYHLFTQNVKSGKMGKHGFIEGFYGSSDGEEA
jgi:hypothetical protein